MRIDKDNIKIILILLVVCLGIGYSYLNTELNINGTANINSANWSVYWNNVQVESGSVTAPTPTIDSDKTTVSYTVTLEKPGDYYEFTVDAVNGGTIDAMIDTIDSKLNGATITTLPDYLKYTVTYSDGVALEPNHQLLHNTTEKYKVRIEYRTDIELNQLPATNQTLSLQFTVTYRQATDDAVAVDHSFNGHSWETIINNVRSGNISNYNVGDTKTVDMGTFGTHTLRIANKSTPEECSTEGFSQTACGFVLEFADIITTHRMNPYTSGDANLDGSTVNGTGNKGGWEYSDMRAFLNSTTYANESIDYSTTGIYSSLPEVLRNAIIDTRVVSGHGSVDTTNYTTIDKLYLLSRREVWNYTGTYDTASSQTRQMDYYASQGVTTSSYSGAIKQNNSSNAVWWLRSALSTSTAGFYFVGPGANPNSNYADYTREVSPAFRIG